MLHHPVWGGGGVRGPPDHFTKLQIKAGKYLCLKVPVSDNNIKFCIKHSDSVTEFWSKQRLHELHTTWTVLYLLLLGSEFVDTETIFSLLSICPHQCRRPCANRETGHMPKHQPTSPVSSNR